MKTSNKLIIALILVSLIAMLGTNLEIKAEYNKIKPDDLFYGFDITPVKSFKTVVLVGNDHGFVEIRPGKSNEVRIKKRLRRSCETNNFWRHTKNYLSGKRTE